MIDFCDAGHIIGASTKHLHKTKPEQTDETARNPEEHVGNLLQNLQRRPAWRDVLIKKPASAGFFMAVKRICKVSWRQFCYYGRLSIRRNLCLKI